MDTLGFILQWRAELSHDTNTLFGGWGTVLHRREACVPSVSLSQLALASKSAEMILQAVGSLKEQKSLLLSALSTNVQYFQLTLVLSLSSNGRKCARCYRTHTYSHR